ELGFDQDGSGDQRLFRRDRARQRRPHLRRQRGEHLPRLRRTDPDTPPRRHDPARHHARHGHHSVPRRGLHGGRAANRPRDALRRRRDLLHGNGGGDHADPVGGPDFGRRRQARSHHRAAPEGLLRPPVGGGGGSPRLALAGAGGGPGLTRG